MLALVLGLAGTAFAATTPFSDVPAKSWAYSAIAQLAKDGIIDGYGDGTFRGDKVMTRYEMAQIVAKAVAREDKANATQKAIIDKLATEFATELNNLGMRVTKLEQNQPAVTFKGAIVYRLDTTTEYDDTTNKATTVNPSQYRLRLDAFANVDDNTIVNFRLVPDSPYTQNPGAYGLVPNNSYVNLGQGNISKGAYNTMGQDPAFEMDRFNIVTNIGGTTLTFGRQSMVNGDNLMIADANYNSYDGLKVAGKIFRY